MYVCGSHGYGELDRGRDGAGVLVSMRDKARGVSRMSKDARVHFECEVIN